MSFFTSIVGDGNNYISLVENALYTSDIIPPITYWNELLITSFMLAPYMISAIYYQHVNSTVYIIPAQLLVDYCLLSEDLDNPHFGYSCEIHILCTLSVLTSSSYCSFSYFVYIGMIKLIYQKH